MRQRWCIALRLPVQLRANNQESGEVLSETKIPADPDLIIKFIENA